MYPRCPECGKDFVRQSQRQGAFEHLLSVIRVYPFRCQVCTHRFRGLEWGEHSTQLIDQREYERIPVRFAVSFSSDRIKGQGNLIELSMGGCSLQTETRLPPGEVLQLSFQASEQDAHIRVEAIVVRSVRPPTVGMEFLRVPSPQKEALRQVVLHHLSQQRV